MSPLSYLRVYEQLRSGLAPRRFWDQPMSSEDGYCVVGSMGNRWIRMEAVPSGTRNSFRPIARVRLDSLARGSRLTGTVRVPFLVRVFSAFWLFAACCFVVVAVGIDVDSLMTGRAAWGDALLVLVPVAMIVFIAALTSWGIDSGRDDTRYLHAWLVERLHASEEQ
jgi:hypothetical protein